MYYLKTKLYNSNNKNYIKGNYNSIKNYNIPMLKILELNSCKKHINFSPYMVKDIKFYKSNLILNIDWIKLHSPYLIIYFFPINTKKSNNYKVLKRKIKLKPIFFNKKFTKFYKITLNTSINSLFNKKISKGIVKIFLCENKKEKFLIKTINYNYSLSIIENIIFKIENTNFTKFKLPFIIFLYILYAFFMISKFNIF